jgi:GNAT superfamily N-acetyltransferase
MSVTGSVRAARETDARDIARLTKQLGYADDAAAAADRLARVLRKPDQVVLIADVDDRVAGWLHAAVSEPLDVDRFVSIVGLVVDADHRGSGIGRQLLEHAETWARAQGCAFVRLTSSSTRMQAHQFYERVGYTNVKTQYSFAKALDPAQQDALRQFIPRVP